MAESAEQLCFETIKKLLEDLQGSKIPVLEEYGPVLQKVINLLAIAKLGAKSISRLKEYLCDPSKGFIYLTTCALAFSATVAGFLRVKSQLPEKFKFEVETMEKQKKEMEETIKGILETIKDITKVGRMLQF